MADIKEHETTIIDIADIKTDNDNPNSMDDAMKKRLRQSMDTWGNTQPIVVDKNTMFLADGEHRMREHVAAGKKQIPAILVDFKDNADRRSYRQAANKIRGSHDPGRDTAEFQRIIDAGRGDLLEIATGMKLGQVEKHMRRYGPSDEELTPDEDGFSVTDDYTPKYDIEQEDIYELGEHKLICADATEPSTYKMLGGEKYDAIITDPPYNLDFHGTSGRFDEMENDNLDNAAYRDFITRSCEMLTQAMPQHGCLYLFIDWRNYERSSEDETGIIHPTMKPIRLLTKLLFNSTQQGQTVLDPFGGSGSTLIACEQTKRRCNVIEIDPSYCSLIIERYLKYVNNDATVWRIRDGKREAIKLPKTND